MFCFVSVQFLWFNIRRRRAFLFGELIIVLAFALKIVFHLARAAACCCKIFLCCSATLRATMGSHGTLLADTSQ